MPIRSVTPNYDEESSFDENGYTVRKSYNVECDDKTTTEYQVCNAPTLPGLGDILYGRSIFKSRTATRVDGSDKLWKVKCEFEPLPPGEEEQPGGGVPAPAGNEYGFPRMSLGYERVTQASDRDYNGTPLWNSADFKFDNADEYEDSAMVITISHTVPFELITMGLLTTWRDTVHGRQFVARFANNVPNAIAEAGVNAGGRTFFGLPPYASRLIDFGADMVQKPDKANKGRTVTAWQINLKFTVLDFWLRAAIDSGFYTNESSSGESAGISAHAGIENAKIIVDANGMPLIKPAHLNGRGGVLKKNADPFWRIWQRWRHDDLNKLLIHLKLPTVLANYKQVVTS